MEHAVPWSPEPAPNEAELLAGVTAKRVVFGHTHLQFARTTAEGLELVNPGSVGLPFDGDTRAGYALLDPEGGVELRRVAYDHERAAADALERRRRVGPDGGTPHRDRKPLTGRYRHGR